MPCGIALPFHRHYLQADVVHVQLRASKPLCRQLWRRLVEVKIANQARTLDLAGEFERAKPLRTMFRRIKGDPAHAEAHAARNYWPALLGDFRRSDETDRRNGLLNYGYAILRGGVARCIVAAGLIPAVGLHHASKSNAFNLADDLIEPYRPIVDHLVHSHTVNNPSAKSASMELSDRQFLAKTLGEQVRLDGQAMPALTAIERSVESLVAAIRSKNSRLLLLPETGG
jgi:CRISPR-associated protein Cas1